jgi:hypothetical protein
MWCARRDSNLRRFAGVSEREPAAEIPSGCARDLKPYGAPGEIRTPDLLLRRQSLYPSELRAHPGLFSLHVSGKPLQRKGRRPRHGSRRRFAKSPVVKRANISERTENFQCAPFTSIFVGKKLRALLN